MRWLHAAALAVVACGGPGSGRPDELRVGYFPNMTHSQVLVGLARGDFERALPGVRIVPRAFNAGPSVIEALYAGELDIACIGPNPAVNGYVRSSGEALRVVAGATSGGAALVVREGAGIDSVPCLSGRRVATPQLGNTQDVALRSFLAARGMAPLDAGGDVEIVPTENPQILDMFRQGLVDAAWVPEPWASRLVHEGGGRILLDERGLWPDSQFTTALIIASLPYLQANPGNVRGFLSAHVDVTLWERAHPSEACAIVDSMIAVHTGGGLAPEVLRAAWSRMEPTWDPLPSTIDASARSAWRAGFLDEQPDLSGLCDLRLLDEVLLERGLDPVGSPGGP